MEKAPLHFSVVEARYAKISFAVSFRGTRRNNRVTRIDRNMVDIRCEPFDTVINLTRGTSSDLSIIVISCLQTRSKMKSVSL